MATPIKLSADVIVVGSGPGGATTACAVGVEGKIRGREFIAEADTVVVSAGGLGFPRILQNS